LFATGCALYSDVSIAPLSLSPAGIDRGSDLQSMIRKYDYLRAIELTSSDLLVVPEQYTTSQFNRLAPGIAKVVGNQNAYRSFPAGTITAAGVVTPYTSSPDVIGALVVSEDSRDYLSYAFPGLDVGHIHQRIDRDIFHLDLASRRKQIAVMPRKRPQDYRQVLGMLTSRGVLDGWTIAELSGMTEAEVGSALRESVLFISLNRAEGFGLPPAEAMASGCYIIGFHGMAGRVCDRAARKEIMRHNEKRDQHRFNLN